MTAKDNLKKYGIAALKGGIGSIPGGSLVVELLNVTIPDRRLERAEKLLMILASKELDMDSEEVKRKFNSPEFADIFEDVSHQAVRALSDERLKYLASVVEHSLRQEEIEHLQIKRLLEIIKEMNDVEIILLQSYEEKNQNTQNFEQKHSSVFDTSKMSSEKASERKVMLNNYKSHLINLGLIGKSRFFHNSQLSITKLGVMLLKLIGLKHDEEKLTGIPFDSINAVDFALDSLDNREREIRRELESDTKKAKSIIEKEIRNFGNKVDSEIRRRSGRLF